MTAVETVALSAAVMEAVSVAVTLATSPLPALLLTLALVALVWTARAEATRCPGDRHYLRRDPDGVWRCQHCPATTDSHGRNP